MKIVITGASGFLGLHLVEHFASLGFSIFAVTRATISIPLPNVTVVKVPSYDDIEVLARIFCGADVIVNTVGRAHLIDESKFTLSSKKYFDANVTSAISIGCSALSASIPLFIHLSSIGVYGDSHGELPIQEDHPCVPSNTYSLSKYVADKCLFSIFNFSPTRLFIFRLPLVVGPRSVGNFNRLLKLLRSGSIVPLGNVTARRTYLHVSNLCSALLVSIRTPSLPSGTYLISDLISFQLNHFLSEILRESSFGTSRLLSIPQPFLRFFFLVAGKLPEYQKLTTSLCCDPSRFVELTGWQPICSAIDHRSVFILPKMQ